MLDGDGAGDPESRFIDPLNDDFATIRLELCPSGMVCPDPPTPPEQETSPATCSVGRSGTSWMWPLLVVIAALLRRRR